MQRGLVPPPSKQPLAPSLRCTASAHRTRQELDHRPSSALEELACYSWHTLKTNFTKPKSLQHGPCITSRRCACRPAHCQSPPPLPARASPVAATPTDPRIASRRRHCQPAHRKSPPPLPARASQVAAAPAGPHIANQRRHCRQAHHKSPPGRRKSPPHAHSRATNTYKGLRSEVLPLGWCKERC